MSKKFIPQFEPLIKRRYAYRVYKQIMSGWIGPGKTTELFEQKIADFVGVKHTLLVNSGTSALMCAIKSLQLPEGSTVLFPSYTFLAGANALKFLGYNVKLIDIQRHTLCMSPALVENELKNDSTISAIMFVNHNGYVGNDLKQIRNIADNYKVKLIEDAACALGQFDWEKTDKWKHAGSTGDVSIFSLSVPKLITTGQGGVVLTNNYNLYKKAAKVRDQGGGEWRKTKIHHDLGVNFKFNDILSSYGLAQFDELPKLLEKRQKIHTWYYKYLKMNSYVWLYRSDSHAVDVTPWFNIISTNFLEEIQRELKKESIQSVQYYKPIHWNDQFAANTDEYPNAVWAYHHLLYLPSSLTLKKRDVKRICSAINRVKFY